MITVDFNRLDVKPGDRILDMGCGSGRHTAEAYMQEGVVAVGSDRNPGDLASAKERLLFHDALGETGGGIWGLAAGDITRLPFKDNSFDLVICSEVLEHIPNDRKAVAELTRVLKPGKQLVVSVPRQLPERICWLLSREYHEVPYGHIRIYRKRCLFRLLESFGYNRQSHHYAHAIHTPYWWLKCLLGPHRQDLAAVNAYNRLLTWDIMEKPPFTRLMDRLLNPLLGKSLVVYLTKET